VNNIVIGANALVAIQSVSDITTLPINPEQIAIIYQAEGNYTSYVPGRTTNTLNSLTEGVGYVIIGLQSVDLSAYFMPPVNPIIGLNPGTIQAAIVTLCNGTNTDMYLTLSSFTWGTNPTGNQFMMAAYRLATDPDEPSSYIPVSNLGNPYFMVGMYGSISEDMPLILDITALGLPANTAYVLQISNLNPGGGSIEIPFITPQTFSSSPLSDIYYPGSLFEYGVPIGSTGYQAEMLPQGPGAYYGLDYDLSDYFGAYNPVSIVNSIPSEQNPNIPDIENGQVGIVLGGGLSGFLPDSRITQATLYGADGSANYAMGLFMFIPSGLQLNGNEFLFCSLDSEYDGMYTQIILNPADGTSLLVQFNQNYHGQLESVTSSNTLVLGAWNQILITRVNGVATVYLNGTATTGAFTSTTSITGNASVPISYCCKVQGNTYLATPVGCTFKNLYYTNAALNATQAATYANPPQPVAILEDFTTKEILYTIPRDQMIQITNEVVVISLPQDIPTGDLGLYMQDARGNGQAMRFHVYPFTPQTEALSIDFTQGQNLTSNFYGIQNQWGGANGGTRAQNVYILNNNLQLEVHGDQYAFTQKGVSEGGIELTHVSTRIGAGIASQNYFGYGSFKCVAQMPPLFGAAFSFGISHQESIFQQDPRYTNEVSTYNLFPQPNAQGLYSVQSNNAIYFSTPSNDVIQVFNTLYELLNQNWLTVFNGEHAAVINDPVSSNNGTWILTGSNPQLLSSWTYYSSYVAYTNAPTGYNGRCETAIGNTGSGQGFLSFSQSNQETFIRFPTPLGVNVWDGNFHEFRFDWYAGQVIFFIDGVQVQVLNSFLPSIPGRIMVAAWFPSQAEENQPTQIIPAQAWAGYPVTWSTQQFQIQSISYTPFTSDVAGGTPTLEGETYPMLGLYNLS
jgi:hypothetical protein